MCKELSSIGSANIKIVASDNCIDFFADADDILKRKVRLGENYDSETDSEDEDSKKIYEATFTTDQFSRISKIAGLSNTMQIFPGNDILPLLFRSSIGSLGKISIYIKSKELVDKEMGEHSDDSDE